MEEMPRKIVGKAISDPQKIYAHPEAVLNDPRLSPDEKSKILRSWEEDQIALMRAEEENMAQLAKTAPAVDLLDKIKKAEKELEETIH